MRAIGLSALLLVAAATSRADTHAQAVDLFASMTAALSEDNVPEFMKACDREMPGYGQLRRGVAALLLESEIASSVEFLKDEGDDSRRSVDLDWYLELRSRQPAGPTRQRRQILHCELVKQGKRWRIVALKPLSFFEP